MATDYIDLSTLAPDATIGPAPTPSGFDQFTGTVTSLFGGTPDALFNLASDLQSLLSDLLGTVKQAVSVAEGGHPLNVITTLTSGLRFTDTLTELFQSDLWTLMQNNIIGGALYDLFIGFLGLAPTDVDADAQAGLKTIDRFIAFAVTLQLMMAGIDGVGKVLLGSRWPEDAMEGIRSIPEKTGMHWAEGIILADLFKAAVGTQVERAILKAKRPNEPEWPIARTMLRQHVLDDTALTEILENSGFSDTWIARIKQLETVPLAPAEINALYRADIIDDTQIDPLLVASGYSDENKAYIRKLYIDQAETQAGAILRTTARSLFRQQLITEADYTTYLTQTHFPARDIADDIAAIKLEQRVGQRGTTVAAIKSSYQHKTITPDVALVQLQQLGYATDAAHEIMLSWDAPHLPRQHGLTEAQATKYYIAGLLGPLDYRAILTQLGVDATTIDFLVAHPTATAGTRVVRLTSGLVTEAYLVGAIQHSDLSDAYTKAGATSDTLPYLIAQAEYKYARHHETGSGMQPLTEGDIKEAFKVGLFDQTTATTALMNLGYSQDNATLILEILNKGPFQPPAAPIFTSLQAAIDYLIVQGFTLSKPSGVAVDTQSAVQMVESAGISVTYPAGWQPPTVPVGGL